MRHLPQKKIIIPLKKQFIWILVLFLGGAFLLTVLITYRTTTAQLSLLNNSLTTYSAQLARTTRNAYDSYENVCYSLAYGTPVQNYLQNDTPEEDY
nr:hypothetical protein [Lachnospiraceae bacterium]